MVNDRNEVVVVGRTTVQSGGDAYVVSGAAGLPDFAAARFGHPLDIDNPYFPVVPGTKYTYRTAGIDPETDERFTERNVVQATSDTRVLAGATTRPVHDQVFRSDGMLKEDTTDHYAHDDGGNVWYFGEDVTNYEYDDRGRLVETTHEGSWLAGVDGAQAGVLMEAAPRAGTRYYQEFAPANDVLDTGVGVAVGGQTRVPAGRFRNVFRKEETTVIEPIGLANKFYDPGVGTVLEIEYDVENNDVLETARLVSVTLNGKQAKQVVPPAGFNGTNAQFGRVIGPARVGGATAITTQRAFVANRAVFNGDVGINSNAEAILIDSELNQPASVAATEHVALRGVFTDGTVNVGGKVDVFVYRSQLQRPQCRLGPNDNDLTAQDFMFDVLDADGGGGHNTFHDRGGNVVDALTPNRFKKS